MLVVNSTTESGWSDSNNKTYYVKKVSYLLNNPEDEVIVELVKIPITFRGLFAFSNATKIALENFENEEVTTIEFMFLNCNSLKEINFVYMKTSKVQNMYGTFLGCSSLKSLNVSNWDTSRVCMACLDYAPL